MKKDTEEAPQAQPTEDGGDELTFDWRLFDLANDPAQQVDVAEQYPYKADDLRRLIEEKLTER